MGILSIKECYVTDSMLEATTKDKETGMVKKKPIALLPGEGFITTTTEGYGSYLSPNFNINLQDDEEPLDNEKLIVPNPESPNKQRNSISTTDMDITLKKFYQDDTTQDISPRSDFKRTNSLQRTNTGGNMDNLNFMDKSLDMSDIQDESIPEIRDHNNSIFFTAGDKDYISMGSKRIKGQNNSIHKNFPSEKKGSNFLSGILNKNTYLIFYLEFNYFNLIKLAREYLMSIYPELNLIMIIELDDNPNTQQKIVLENNIEKNKYIPMNNQEDQNQKSGFRFIRFVSYADNNNNAHKIKIQISTYTNDKLSVISEDEIYFETNPSYEMHKFQILNNMISKAVSKKIGNIFMKFTYKVEYLNKAIEVSDNLYQHYMSLFSVC